VFFKFGRHAAEKIIRERNAREDGRENELEEDLIRRRPCARPGRSAVRSEHAAAILAFKPLLKTISTPYTFITAKNV
jgi:hypothetical protein